MKVKETGYYDCYGDKRVCLLRAGDEVKHEPKIGDGNVYLATCHNSRKEVLVIITD